MEPTLKYEPMTLRPARRATGTVKLGWRVVLIGSLALATSLLWPRTPDLVPGVLVLRVPGAERVRLLGDFGVWTQSGSVLLERLSEDDSWTATVALPAGRYRARLERYRQGRWEPLSADVDPASSLGGLDPLSPILDLEADVGMIYVEPQGRVRWIAPTARLVVDTMRVMGGRR
jgi:hypothetical protein